MADPHQLEGTPWRERGAILMELLVTAEAVNVPGRSPITPVSGTSQPNLTITVSSVASDSNSGTGAAVAVAQIAREPGVDALDPQRLCETFLHSYRVAGDRIACRLMYQGGCFRHWCRGAWRAWGEEEADQAVRRHAEEQARREHADNLLDWRRRRSENGAAGRPPKRKHVTDAVVRSALSSVRAAVLAPAVVVVPCWLTPLAGRPDPARLVPTETAVFNPASGELMPVTPELFVTHAAPHAVGEAPQPARWLEFIDRTFAGDAESIAALQEFFGLCLVADTSFQKACLVVGPENTGKSVIGGVLGGLSARPTSARTAFHLLGGTLRPLGAGGQSSRGHRRFPRRQLGRECDALSTFLSVTAGGMVPIDRKHRDPASGRISRGCCYSQTKCLGCVTTRRGPSPGGCSSCRPAPASTRATRTRNCPSGCGPSWPVFSGGH